MAGGILYNKDLSWHFHRGDDVVLTKGKINTKFMAENIQAESDAAKNLKSLPR